MSWISMASSFKKAEVIRFLKKLDLLTDIDMLIMFEKGIRGGLCHSIHRYAKGKNKYMKEYDKNKESSYLKYWDVTNLYGLTMSQWLPVNNVLWIEHTSPLNQDFIFRLKIFSWSWCSISQQNTWSS